MTLHVVWLCMISKAQNKNVFCITSGPQIKSRNKNTLANQKHPQRKKDNLGSTRFAKRKPLLNDWHSSRLKRPPLDMHAHCCCHCHDRDPVSLIPNSTRIQQRHSARSTTFTIHSNASLIITTGTPFHWYHIWPEFNRDISFNQHSLTTPGLPNHHLSKLGNQPANTSYHKSTHHYDLDQSTH